MVVVDNVWIYKVKILGTVRYIVLYKHVLHRGFNGRKPGHGQHQLQVKGAPFISYNNI